MARRKQAPKDLTGIRQRGGRYQIRLFGGQDPVTGKQVMLTGSAEDEEAAIKLRDKFRRQVAEATAARTSVSLGYLLDEWLAGLPTSGSPPAAGCGVPKVGPRHLLRHLTR
jgi:integrase